MKLKVPTYKQGKNQCGPASLKMVLEYLEEEVPVKKIIMVCGGMGKGKVKGMTMLNMEKGVKKQGYKVTAHNFMEKRPSKKTIISFLNKKMPVIISLRTFIFYNEKNKSDKGHFIVITGHKKGKFYYNDPWNGKKNSIAEEKLLLSWFIHVLNSTKYLMVIKK